MLLVVAGSPQAAVRAAATINAAAMTNPIATATPVAAPAGCGAVSAPSTAMPATPPSWVRSPPDGA